MHVLVFWEGRGWWLSGCSGGQEDFLFLVADPMPLLILKNLLPWHTIVRGTSPTLMLSMPQCILGSSFFTAAQKQLGPRETLLASAHCTGFVVTMPPLPIAHVAMRGTC